MSEHRAAPQREPRQRSIEELRNVVSMLCHFICHRQTRPGDHLWSIPVDPERDFDCILTDAIDELERLRAAPQERHHSMWNANGDWYFRDGYGDVWRLRVSGARDYPFVVNLLQRFGQSASEGDSSPC